MIGVPCRAVIYQKISKTWLRGGTFSASLFLAAPTRSSNKEGLKINIWYAAFRGGLPAGQSGLTSIAIMLLREGALRYYERRCMGSR